MIYRTDENDKPEFILGKAEIVKAMHLEDFGAFDYALPLLWLEDKAKKLYDYGFGRDDLVDCVWLYPRIASGVSWGRPFPLTDRAIKALVVLEEYCGGVL